MPPTLDIIKAVRLPFIDKNKKVKESELSQIFLSKTESEKFVADVRNALSQEGTLIGLNGMIKFLKGLRDIVESGDTSPLMGYGIPPVKEEDKGTDKDSVKNILFVIRRVLISLEDRKRQARVSAGQAGGKIGGKIGGLAQPTWPNFQKLMEQPSKENIRNIVENFQKNHSDNKFKTLVLEKRGEITPLLEENYMDNISYNDFATLTFYRKEGKKPITPEGEKALQENVKQIPNAEYVDGKIVVRGSYDELLRLSKDEDTPFAVMLGNLRVSKLKLVNLLSRDMDLEFQKDIIYNEISDVKAKEYIKMLNGKDWSKFTIPDKLRKAALITKNGDIIVNEAILYLMESDSEVALNEELEDFISTMGEINEDLVRSNFIGTHIRDIAALKRQHGEDAIEGISEQKKRKLVEEDLLNPNSIAYKEFNKNLQKIIDKKKLEFAESIEEFTLNATESEFLENLFEVLEENYDELEKIEYQNSKLSEYIEDLLGNYDEDEKKFEDEDSYQKFYQLVDDYTDGKISLKEIPKPTIPEAKRVFVDTSKFTTNFDKNLAKLMYVMMKKEENIYDAFTQRISKKELGNRFVKIVNALVTLDSAYTEYDEQISSKLAKLRDKTGIYDRKEGEDEDEDKPTINVSESPFSEEILEISDAITNSLTKGSKAVVNDVKAHLKEMADNTITYINKGVSAQVFNELIESEFLGESVDAV